VNPFRETIVASPWEAPRADVPEIHGHVFERCLDGIRHVRESGRSAALLIHGEAGSGKTHLLSRLRAHLAPREPTATDRRECLYVWVRLQTSPRMIWRTLRRTLVDDWFRPVVGGRTQFERILFHRLAEIRVAEGDLEHWYEYMLEEHPAGLTELMDRIARSLDLDRNTAVAFMHIAFRRHLRDLRAWLAGASLPQGALDQMNLADEEGGDEEREYQSRQVVLMLCRLAGNHLPIVLSFDQVEALQMAPGDRDALFAFGQMTSTLHDGTSNVLLVSCVQSAFATELKDFARLADYDRMTSLGALSLDPLDRAQAEQLIARRIASTPDRGTTSLPQTGCWPLEPLEFEDLFAKGFVSPRKLLSLCAERFETRASRPALSGAVNGEPADATQDESAAESRFLAEEWGTRVARKLAENAPDNTEEIIRHGLPLLVRIVAPRLKTVWDEQLPDVPLVFEGAEGRTGLCVCAQSNMNSLAARLKRLKTQFALQRLQRLVIVRDPRVPIPPTAKTTLKHLADLEQQRANVVAPTVETLAALDALRELLSDAKSGDLTGDNGAIAAPLVERWLLSQLPEKLRELVNELRII
jgi:AAA domain